MKLFNQPKIKIITAVFFAFITVKIMFTGGVFFGNTPQIHPSFMTRVKNIPVYLVHLPNKFINRLRPSIDIPNSPNNKSASPLQTNPDEQLTPITFPTVVPPPSLKFIPIAKGVYAAEDPITKKVYVNIKKGTKFTVVNKVINGKQFRFLIPKKK